LGTLASAEISKLPTGPIIILVGTVGFLASLLGAPRRGLLARAAADRKFRNDLRLHTLLRQLYEAAEAGPTRGSQRLSVDLRRALGWSESQFRKVTHEAVLQQLIVRRVDDTLSLTPSGLEYAGRVVRGYRIWQRFLIKYPDQNSSLTALDFQHVDDALPADVVRALEMKLKDEGRLPSAGTIRHAAFGGNSA
jgi:manganese/zinc/iron transport system permease protein